MRAMNKELETAIMTAADLPTIPVVALKVMQLIESDSATADDLAKIVASDPAVAARVLKISNSSFYGCQRQIQTLSSAVVILGFSTLRSLVVAASVKQVYRPYGLTEKMLWEHSFAAGLAGRVIAGLLRCGNVEEAFLAGLFHDIGKIIMNTLDKRKFQEVMQHCYNEGLSFTDAEKLVFPFSHDEVGAHVIRKWNFPEILTEAVLHHHNLNFEASDDPALAKLTAIISLADQFCLKLGVGVREPQDIDLPRSRAAELLDAPPEQVELMWTTFQEAFEKDRNIFA